MTRRIPGAKLRLIRRGDLIRADWLNDVAAAAEFAAQAVQVENNEVPEGEDASGLPDSTYTETGRTTSTVRIEDVDDPAVYVDIERIDSVSFVNGDGDPLTLNFSNT